MSSSLTQNAIVSLYTGEASANNSNPVLQVLSIVALGTEEKKRYMLKLSDGSYSLSCMIGTQMNSAVESGMITEFDVISIHESICNKIENNGTQKTIVIVLNFSKVASQSQQINNPRDFTLLSEQEKNNIINGRGNNNAVVNPYAQGQPQQKESKGNNNAVNNPYAKKPSSAYKNPYQQRTATSAAPQYNNNSTSNSSSDSNFVLISDLNPYNRAWSIKARLTNKGNVKEWSNNKGTGRLMSVTFLDKAGSEVRATMFNDEVDRLEPLLQLNKVHIVSNGRIKNANPRYNKTNSNFEITFGRETIIELCTEDDNEIKALVVKPVPIANLADMSLNQPQGGNGGGSAFVDIVAIIKDVGEARHIESRSGKSLLKRELTLMDQSKSTIQFTCWGEKAHEHNDSYFSGNPVLAIKGAKLSEWNGRSLSAGYGSQMELNPDIPEAHELKGWWMSEGSKVTDVNTLTGTGTAGGQGAQRFQEGVDNITKRGTLADISNQRLGLKPDGQADWLNVKATVSYIKTEKYAYPSCPETKKKLIEEGPNQWRNPSTEKSFPEPHWRYILNTQIMDESGMQWCTFFDEEAEKFLGKSAQELSGMSDFERDYFFKTKLYTPMQMCLRISQQSYNDEQRLRVNAKFVQHMSYAKENAQLLAAIDSYA
eukprot:g619.t1